MGKKRGWTLHPVGTQVDETPWKKRATVVAGCALGAPQAALQHGFTPAGVADTGRRWDTAYSQMTPGAGEGSEPTERS